MKQMLLRFSAFMALLLWSAVASAQCPANSPIYAIRGNITNFNNLYTVDPTTGAITNTNQTMIQAQSFYTSPAGYPSGVAQVPTSLAYSGATGTLWYTGNVGTRNLIYSASVSTSGTTTTLTPKSTWSEFYQANGTTKVTSGICYSASVNPIDGSVWFYIYGTTGTDISGFYRLDPGNPAAGAKCVSPVNTNPALNGRVDFVFDATGNIIATSSGLTLYMFPARYDAAGNYQGVGTTGSAIGSLNYSTNNSLAFLSNGNLIAGGSSFLLTPPISGVSFYNMGTGAQTQGQTTTENNNDDMASCFSGSAPNLVVQKTGTVNCSNNTVQFTITVQNTAAAFVSGAILKDTTPSGLTLVSATRNGTTLTAAQRALLSTTGLPLQTATSNTDSIMNGGSSTSPSTCTIVLNYTYTTTQTYSNQGFVQYNGVQLLNLPNNQIPSDDPSTTAVNDPTVAQATSAAGTVFLPTQNAVSGPSPVCNKANGYTYYYLNGDQTKKLFAINWTGSSENGTSTGTITYNTGGAPFGKSYGSATCNIMGRVIQITPPSGAVISASGVKVRIYYNTSEVASAKSMTGAPVADSGWFKHPNDFTATRNDNSGATLFNATYFTPTRGTEDGVAYVEYSGVTSFSTFGFVATNKAGSTLPVTLANFTAKAVNCEAIVSWTGTAENNFSYYEVQQSTDGQSFTTAEKIVGKGSGTNYTSRFALSANSEYVRLKMTDNGGTVSYSDILSVNSNCGNGVLPALFPNPTTGKFTINHLGIGNKNIVINAVNGAIVYKGSTTNPSVDINAASWATGIYFVRIATDGKNTTVIKVVKK